MLSQAYIFTFKPNFQVLTTIEIYQGPTIGNIPIFRTLFSKSIFQNILKIELYIHRIINM